MSMLRSNRKRKRGYVTRDLFSCTFHAITGDPKSITASNVLFCNHNRHFYKSPKYRYNEFLNKLFLNLNHYLIVKLHEFYW